MSIYSKNQMTQQNALFKKGIQYIDEHGYIEKAKMILDVTGNLRLVGDTGAGKTTMVHRLAEIY